MRNPTEIVVNGRTLADILADHARWLADEDDGCRADLRGAVLRDVDLRDADLSGAVLRDVDLRDADLYGADLSGAVGILAAGPVGSRADFTYFVQHDTVMMVKCGCFWGTLDEFAAAVEKTHGDNQHGRTYRALIALVRVWGQEAQP